MDEIHAWAYLNRVVEATHPQIVRLVTEFGPVEVAERIKARAGLPEGLLNTTQARADVDQSGHDLELAAAMGWRLIYPGHPEWPGELLSCFTTLEVRDRADAPPLALWVRGRDLRDVVSEAVAIVGTRMASSYGLSLIHI